VDRAIIGHRSRGISAYELTIWPLWVVCRQRIIRGLYHHTIKGTYAGTRERLAERYRQVLSLDKDKEIAGSKGSSLLLEEAWSFHGGGD
jgi:hypothetical protein